MIKLIVPRQNQPLHEGDGGLYVYPRRSHHKKKWWCDICLRV